MWKHARDAPKRVIFSGNSRHDLITKAHNESGHRGRDPTLKKLSDFYYWPSMWREVGTHCRACVECQM
ncbi:hypothetical protein DL93DRAFT_2113625, partial [Clavulina sp. PMI_390]